MCLPYLSSGNKVQGKDYGRRQKELRTDSHGRWNFPQLDAAIEGAGGGGFTANAGMAAVMIRFGGAFPVCVRLRVGYRVSLGMDWHGLTWRNSHKQESVDGRRTKTIISVRRQLQR